MNLVFEVDNVLTEDEPRPTQARLPFKMKLVVVEGLNKHNLTLCFNRRLANKMVERIELEQSLWGA